MDVKEILALKGNFVLTILPEATIDEAARILAENHIGAVVVTTAAGRIAGILSERDIAVSLPKYGPSLGTAKVSEIMTADVVFCGTETTVNEVLDIMVGNGIRHLPVVGNDELIGVVSLRDVVGNWLGSFAGDETDAVSAEARPLEPFAAGSGTGG